MVDQIDPATVQRCIELVERSALVTRDAIVRDLRKLLPKTEAQNLVEEWWEHNGSTIDGVLLETGE